MIKFYCPSCRRKLGVPDEYAGRRVRCTQCNRPCAVPCPGKAEPPPESGASSNTAEAAPVGSSAGGNNPGEIELQPMRSFEREIPLEEDRNADILRQYRRNRHTCRPHTQSAQTESKPLFERFGPFADLLNPIVQRIGTFPLAVVASVLVTAAVIAIWNVLAAAIGTPLEIFYVAAAIASGIGLCLVSEHRGTMMGLLAMSMAFLAIIAARVVQTHLFVFPEWKTIVAAVEVPPEREKLYLIMNQMTTGRMRADMRKEVAENNTEMIASAVASLILDGHFEPSLGQELYFSVQSRLGHAGRSYDPNGIELAFTDPTLTEAWPAVTERLRQWDTEEKRIEAAGRYHFRRLFLNEQCRYKALLDDYPLALTTGFFVVDGCIFMFLRMLYCLVGLIGAYKTCSESFMD